MAGKPVMEGKGGVLFKSFADVDVFDIELNTKDSDELIRTVKLLEPTFGGINLEDIKGPECFYIEEKLKEIMDIPVFHDDQHGTAIISAAGSSTHSKLQVRMSLKPRSLSTVLALLVLPALTWRSRWESTRTMSFFVIPKVLSIKAVPMA